MHPNRHVTTKIGMNFKRLKPLQQAFTITENAHKIKEKKQIRHCNICHCAAKAEAIQRRIKRVEAIRIKNLVLTSY